MVPLALKHNLSDIPAFAPKNRFTWNKSTVRFIKAREKALNSYFRSLERFMRKNNIIMDMFEDFFDVNAYRFAITDDIQMVCSHMHSFGFSFFNK